MKTSALDKETPGLAALVEEVRQGEEDRLDRPRTARGKARCGGRSR